MGHQYRHGITGDYLSCTELLIQPLKILGPRLLYLHQISKIFNQPRKLLQRSEDRKCSEPGLALQCEAKTFTVAGKDTTAWYSLTLLSFVGI